MSESVCYDLYHCILSFLDNKELYIISQCKHELYEIAEYYLDPTRDFDELIDSSMYIPIMLKYLQSKNVNVKRNVIEHISEMYDTFMAYINDIDDANIILNTEGLPTIHDILDSSYLFGKGFLKYSITVLNIDDTIRCIIPRLIEEACVDEVEFLFNVPEIRSSICKHLNVNTNPLILTVLAKRFTEKEIEEMIEDYDQVCYNPAFTIIDHKCEGECTNICKDAEKFDHINDLFIDPEFKYEPFDPNNLDSIDYNDIYNSIKTNMIDITSTNSIIDSLLTENYYSYRNLALHSIILKFRGYNGIYHEHENINILHDNIMNLFL